MKELAVTLLFCKFFEGDEDEAIEKSFKVLKKIRDYSFLHQADKE